MSRVLSMRRTKDVAGGEKADVEEEDHVKGKDKMDKEDKEDKEYKKDKEDEDDTEYKEGK